MKREEIVISEDILKSYKDLTTQLEKIDFSKLFGDIVLPDKKIFDNISHSDIHFLKDIAARNKTFSDTFNEVLDGNTHIKPLINQQPQKKVKYFVMPIDEYVEKHGKPLIETAKDVDLQNYLNDGKALSEHKTNRAKTYIVFTDEFIIGYFTLRLNAVKNHLVFYGMESQAYNGCDINRKGMVPVYELLMYAKNDYNSLIKMKEIFKNDILKKLAQNVSSIGSNILYLECTKELLSVYSDLGFIAYRYFLVGKENKTRMYSMIRRIIMP